MLKHYLAIALRNLKNNKSFTFINITGLAVGMSCAMLIFLWVKDELSYDRFHQNIEQIHRVVSEYDGYRVPTTPGPMAAYLKAEIPEIAEATRFRSDEVILQYGDQIIRAAGINAEPAFLDIFTFPELAGDSKGALDGLGSIVLTESTAEKLFGEVNPIGKTLKISNQWDAQVAAIVEDVPDNSSPPLRFDYLQSFNVYYPWREPDNWYASSDYYTWVLLEEGSALQTVNQKIDDLLRRHGWDPKQRMLLQPMEEIHLRADTHRWDGPHGDIRYVIIFSLLAAVILGVACINFMNLATARSMQRSREIGIRKVVGAQRGQIIGQFLGESFLYTVLALPVTYLLIELALPTFNRIAGKEIAFNITEPFVLWGSFSLVLLTGLLSGTYPALFLSAFKPIKILQNFFSFSKDDTGSGASFRRTMVVTQFTLSIIAIICTITIYTQLDFIHNRPLGYDQENLIYVPLGGNYGEDSYQALKNELQQQSQIISVGGSDQIPVDTDFVPVIKWYDGATEHTGSFATFMVDEDFLETYNMELTQGRFFSREYATDREQGIVINEAAADAMGMEEPLGQKLEVYDREGTIIGVVNNFHFETLREQIEPAYMIYQPQSHYVNIRIRSGNTPATISLIERIVKKHYPSITFEFRFMDEEVDALYQADQRTGEIFSYFTLLTIFIACLGLYSLATFVVEQKTKEIGIRKVLGASLANIVSLLTRDFIRWILLANLIAWPVAWLAMEFWLQNFAYQAGLTLWPFLASGVAALMIALLTVSWQTVRAATANPVESLRYE